MAENKAITVEEIRQGGFLVENARRFVLPTRTMAGRSVLVREKMQAVKIGSWVSGAILNIPGVEMISFSTGEHGLDNVTLTRKKDEDWGRMSVACMRVLDQFLSFQQKNAQAGLVNFDKMEPLKNAQILIQEFNRQGNPQGISEIRASFEILNRQIAKDGGGAEFTRYTNDNYIEYRLLGSCNGCDGSRFTVDKGLNHIIPVLVRSVVVKGWRPVGP